ncbi:MAG: hypothetical protein ACP5OG_01785 [Candidatus Nanoarchaeia archaeon]
MKSKEQVSKKQSKQEIQDKIKTLSLNLNSNNIRKIKKLAMKKNIKIKNLKKSFCKKCLFPFDSKSKIRIKKGFKLIKCKCGYVSRYKLG